MAAAQNVRSGSSPVPTHDPDLRSRPPIQTFRKDLIQTFDPDLWNDIMYWWVDVWSSDGCMLLGFLLCSYSPCQGHIMFVSMVQPEKENRHITLGGGNSNILFFSPSTWGKDIQFWLIFFSNGMKPRTSTDWAFKQVTLLARWWLWHLKTEIRANRKNLGVGVVMFSHQLVDV